MAFYLTIKSSDEDNRIINHHIQLILYELQYIFGFVDSIYLVGSFARGEGKLIGNRPENDYDLLILWRNSIWPIIFSYFLRQRTQKIKKTLDIRYLHIMSTTRTRCGKPTIFNLDNQYSNYRVFGSTELSQCSKILAKDIPHGEIQKLIINRSLCLLEARPKIEPFEEIFEYREFVVRQMNKAALALLDRELFQRENYAGTVRERLDLALSIDNQSIQRCSRMIQQTKFESKKLDFHEAFDYWMFVFSEYEKTIDHFLRPFPRTARIEMISQSIKKTLKSAPKTQDACNRKLISLVNETSRLETEAWETEVKRCIRNWYVLNDGIPDKYKEWAVL